MGGQWESFTVLASAPTPQGMDGFGLALAKMVVALVLVCVAAYVALRLARRFLAPGATGEQRMQVVARCPLGPRQQLWLVRVEGRLFLLGSADGGISKLAELEPGAAQELSRTAAGSGRGFADLLRGLRGRDRRGDEP